MASRDTLVVTEVLTAVGWIKSVPGVTSEVGIGRALLMHKCHVQKPDDLDYTPRYDCQN
jgi:hypothetical protein